MKVSIVIVNYNYGQFLRQAIESALAQTYHDTEVIVIDDGSTDDSGEIIKSYGDSIIPVLKSNGGQSSCYARGLEIATGDLLLYLDADDFLYPNCIKEVVETWKDGCVKAHFYLDVVEENGTRMNAVVPSGRLGTGADPLKMMRIFGAYCSPPASGNIYSREFLLKVLPQENDSKFRRFDDMVFGADSVPIFAAPYFGTIAAIPRSLGCYRRHANASDSVMPVFDVETSLKTLQRQHQNDLVRDCAWRSAAGQAETSKLIEPSRLKRRMCYLRLSGIGLDRRDNRWNLFAKGVISTICWDGYSWAQKIAICAWFSGMAVLPFSMVGRLIRPALGISNRTPGLRRFLLGGRTGPVTCAGNSV